MMKHENVTTARLLPNNANTNNEYTLVTVLKYLVRCSVIPEEGISLLYTASGSPSWGPPIFFIFTQSFIYQRLCKILLFIKGDFKTVDVNIISLGSRKRLEGVEFSQRCVEIYFCLNTSKTHDWCSISLILVEKGLENGKYRSYKYCDVMLVQ